MAVRDSDEAMLACRGVLEEADIGGRIHSSVVVHTEGREWHVLGPCGETDEDGQHNLQKGSHKVTHFVPRW